MTCHGATGPSGGSPCEGCGLCCNGVLYSRARVEPGEESRISSAGLDLLDVGDRQYFRLPCHFEQDGLCSIYESRFTICRSFRCALLRRTDAGEVSNGEARSTVSEARALLAAVASEDPDCVTYVDRQRRRADLVQAMASATDIERPGLARRLLRMIALDEFLDRHFRNRKVQACEDGVTVG